MPAREFPPGIGISAIAVIESLPMRLADFIDENRDAIIAEWETFANTLAPAASMTQLQLRDHIDEILSFISGDLKTSQTDAERLDKSYGKSDSSDAFSKSAAEAHGTLRHNDGFDIKQMVSEYRALRSSVVKLWTVADKVLDHTDVRDLTRFNEAIDQALAESVVTFTTRVDYSTNLLLGVLGHDLRSPLGAISMAGAMIPQLGGLSDKQMALASTIKTSSDRMAHVISDLLDLARARQGTGLPVKPTGMDMGELARQIVVEVVTRNPSQNIDLHITGDVTGEWDSTRLSQIFTNLLGNAAQYGQREAPIKVSVKGTPRSVLIVVHNEGHPIPAEQMKTLFHSFTRGATSHAANAGTNLGLGLFITNEIVKSHGGTIEVQSSQLEGTSFSVTLPRQYPKP